MIKSVAGSAPTLFAALGLSATALLSGASVPSTGVDAELLGRAYSEQSLTASTWSVVVNGTPTAKTFTPTNASQSFTLNNNGNVNLTAVTVTVTSNYTKSVRVCPAGGTCTTGGTTVAAGATVTIPHTATQEPRTAGTAKTWAYKRGAAGSGTITVSASVSSASITPAPGTTNN